MHLLKNKSLEAFNFKYVAVMSMGWGQEETKIFLILELVVLILIFMFLTRSWSSIGSSAVVEVMPGIEVPVTVGQGQHGTSRFMTTQEKQKAFYLVDNPMSYTNQNLGLVLQMKVKGDKEIIICIKEDIHSLILGASRSGKTRCLILQTIWLRGIAKKSMIISDPKGELFLYTKDFLKENGMEVIDIDFRYPLKSRYYNYMNDINRAVDIGDIPKAIDYTWDLVSVLVGVPKGEPLWNNGESAVIAAGILVLALEAPKEFRNLTNVYYFLANMCKENEYGELPIDKYFKTLPETHPARGVFAVAELSPSRTRGSFFGSALATLRLFTNWNIADMTSKQDFDIKDIGRKPTALFIIIPDEKNTLYSLVSLMINQLYVKLVELANESGGRVPCEVEFELDEFGNFPEIPSFASMLTVGAGRGLRFNLVVQDFQQLQKKYKDDYESIKGNCQNWLYLASPTPKTLEEISKKLGTYTVQVNSTNSSVSGKTVKNVSFSDSASMQSRALLTADEVGRIKRPYSLAMKIGEHPAIMEGPDLSKYKANRELGLGDEEYNKQVIMKRENERDSRRRADLKLWGIWNSFNSTESEQEEVNNRISFIND